MSGEGKKGWGVRLVSVRWDPFFGSSKFSSGFTSLEELGSEYKELENGECFGSLTTTRKNMHCRPHLPPGDKIGKIEKAKK